MPMPLGPTVLVMSQETTEITHIRSEELADRMANDFTRNHPKFAARHGILPWQRFAGVLTLSVLVTSLVFAAHAVAIVLAVLGTALFVLKIALSLWGAARSTVHGADPELPDDQLPFYTVLVPAYHEASVIGDTIRSICAMNYPPDRLEVLVLVETGDAATKQAVLDIEPPSFVRVVDAPPGVPQTKPRTCNLGLMVARGDLLVIFDAEDRPEPDQLRKVAARFANSDDGLACVQARLNFYNAHRNLLTRQFALDYALRFELLLHGLAALRLPIPLGGTSNHFRVDLLREVGGWDAWNVTEDADLGMRCSALGYRIEMTDSTTWEEAVERPWPWIRQRTRWMKGHYMTTLVHMREPRDAWQRFGTRGIVLLLGLVFGIPASFMALSVVGALSLLGVALPMPLTVTTLAVLALYAGVQHYAGKRRGLVKLGPAALLLPIYWFLLAVAAWRGLWQLIRSPFGWEKTEHGTPAPRH
ncbi:glycosyltransferase [Lentzea sp. DG1S-22]|uniref:glycosyltransferase n=1 Tax=Lentzea sp. DG1S-22 TaxID=3108822 RepID=UPI002E77A424|nr:glycosyltransferase [Lentzea sp. DG1S-22]WVH82371.1 glycosyltransferase [Lentzea sp. DG1S-22]